MNVLNRQYQPLAELALIVNARSEQLSLVILINPFDAEATLV